MKHRGGVVDASGAVLPGATVALLPSGPVAVTGPDGTFCLREIPAGEHVATVSLDGFYTRRVTLRVPQAPDSALTIVMAPGIRADVVVTATRTSRNLGEVPVRTEVITRDLITRSGSRTLADAVEYTTGIRVENKCQNCNFSQIRLLGLDGPYTQILVDGQPVVSSLAQVYGIEQIPARMIERIEVVKGGGSALYGPGSVGGVVNIIPREPPRTGGVLEMRGDTFGSDANLSLNGGADWVDADRQTFLTVFGQFDRVRPFDVDGDGFTEVSRRELQASGFRLNRYQLTGRAKLTFDLTHVREDRRGGDSLHLPPDQALVAESIDSSRLALSGTWFHSVSRRFDYRVTASTADSGRDSYYGTGRDPNAFGQSESRVFVVDAQLNHYAGRHTVSWGAAEPDFGSREFFRTPRRYANATLTWQIPKAADIFAAARYTGRMKAPHYAGYVAEDRLETTSPFLLVDLAISRTIKVGEGPRLVIGLSARNVTDAYQGDLDRGPLRDSAYVYGPRFPRSIGATLRVEY